MDIFRDEFCWMQRERKGLYPWAKSNHWRMARVTGSFCDGPFCHHGNGDGVDLVNRLLRTQVLENALFDLFVKALVRAEIRFISRFVPQRSHEERLTGNIVSEMDAAVFLTKQAFRDASLLRYGLPKEIDFYYYDLSRGGRIEKTTGADLGLIVVVDLPDHPFLVRSIVLQAKKCDGNPSIDLEQLQTLYGSNPQGAGYLFYDMNMKRLVAPLVLPLGGHPLSKLLSEGPSPHKSRALDFSEILQHGSPLSFFLFGDLIEGAGGEAHSSFESARDHFHDLCGHGVRDEGFSGRIAIVSLGRPIQVNTNSDNGLSIRV